MQPHQSQRHATRVAFSVPGPSVFPKALYGGITTSKSTGQKQRGEGKMGERGGGGGGGDVKWKFKVTRRRRGGGKTEWESE